MAVVPDPRRGSCAWPTKTPSTSVRRLRTREILFPDGNGDDFTFEVNLGSAGNPESDKEIRGPCDHIPAKRGRAGLPRRALPAHLTRHGFRCFPCGRACGRSLELPVALRPAAGTAVSRVFGGDIARAPGRCRAGSLGP